MALLYSIQFKSIGKGVVFGCMSQIKGAKHIEIGDNCRFGNNLRLEAIEHYGTSTFSPNIKFGKNIVINQNFHCTCADSIEIGDGTSITANCGIFDIIHPYEDVLVNPRCAEIKSKRIKIGRDCLIGMNSVLLPGTVLGNHCVVGANSTVLGTFSDYCVIAGSPAKIIKQYDPYKKEWITLLD